MDTVKQTHSFVQRRFKKMVIKASATLAYVESHLEDITAEQIGKCTRVWDCQTNTWFYLVENEEGAVDEHGDIIEYPVRYNAIDGFSCGCKSGEFKFHNVKHPSGVCKHVRWSIACSIEERNALAAITASRSEGARLRHAASLPAVTVPVSIEKKWNIPQWMLERPVAPHMKNAPKER
jgi:hypothetical protein